MHNSLPAMLVADSPGLDFLNSVATPIDTPVDCLHDGAALLDWLTQTQLVPEGVLSRVRKQGTAAELDAIAAQARDLREWFRSFVMAHKGKPLQAADLRDLKPLNRLLERDEAFTQIVADAPSGPSKLRLEARRRWRAPGTLLLPIAEAMARLITTED